MLYRITYMGNYGTVYSMLQEVDDSEDPLFFLDEGVWEYPFKAFLQADELIKALFNSDVDPFGGESIIRVRVEEQSFEKFVDFINPTQIQ